MQKSKIHHPGVWEAFYAKAEVWLGRAQHAQGEQIILYGWNAESVEVRGGKWGWKGREGWTCDSPLKGGMTPPGALGNVKGLFGFWLSGDQGLLQAFSGWDYEEEGQFCTEEKTVVPRMSTGFYWETQGQTWKALQSHAKEFRF